MEIKNSYKILTERRRTAWNVVSNIIVLVVWLRLWWGGVRDNGVFSDTQAFSSKCFRFSLGKFPIKIPICCLACGKVVGDKWDTYLHLLSMDYGEGYRVGGGRHDGVEQAVVGNAGRS